MCLTYKNHIFVVTPEKEKSATGNTSNLTVFFFLAQQSDNAFYKKELALFKKCHITSCGFIKDFFFFTSSALLYRGPMLIFKSKFAVPLFLSSRAGNHKENLISSL